MKKILLILASIMIIVSVKVSFRVFRHYFPLHQTIEEIRNKKMQIIITDLLSPGGRLTQKSHESFWKEIIQFTKDENTQDQIIKIMLKSLEFEFEFFKETLESAKISFKKKKVLKTQRMIKLEKAELDNFKKSLPPLSKTISFRGSVEAHKKMIMEYKNISRKLLSAAANHQEKLILPGGDEIIINLETIQLMIDSLTKSIKRLKNLFDKKWKHKFQN